MRASKVFSGLGWTTSAAVLNLSAQFVFMAVLARKLDPAAFGIMLMAIVATRFASYFAQLGAAQTLIQAADVGGGLTTAALLMTIAASTLLYAGLVVASPLFGWYFQAPELAQLLTVFGLTLPLAAVGTLPMALLRRGGRFRATSVIEVLAYVFGYGAMGVAMASMGYGVWSLVAGSLAQQTIVLVLAFAVARYPLQWPLRRLAWRQVVGTGSRFSLIGFFEFLWANVESLVVGRMLGQTQLGLLNRAQLLCNLPVEQAVNTTSKVLFPALSAMQRDHSRLGDGFLIMLLGTGFVSTALSAGVSAAAPDAVALLLGSQWAAAVPLVQLLAAAVPPMFAYIVCGIALDSVAALKAKLVLQASLLALKVALVLVLAHWGMTGIAAAIVACELLRAVLGLRLVARALQLEWRMLWRVLGVMCSVGAAVYSAVYMAREGTVALGLPLLARVAAEVITGGGALAAIAGLSLRHWRKFAPLQRFESVRGQMHRLHKFVYRVPRS